MRRRFARPPLFFGAIESKDSVAGDFLVYDKFLDKKFIVSQDSFDESVLYPRRYTTVGIVVIPGSHNVYGGNKAGIMSLVPMSCDTPTVGGSEYVKMSWGVYEAEVSGLSLYNHIVLCNNGTSAQSAASGYYTYSNVPSDLSTFVGDTCPTDSKTKYRSASDSTVSPSPYIESGGRNPVYYQTSSPSVSTNCLSDFDGRGNTGKILAQRGSKDYSSWKPTAAADFPAASCCDMFSPEGTSQGDWYLPSAAEAGYIVVRQNLLNTCLAKITGAVALSTSSYHWTSTGYDTLFSRLFLLSNGSITYGNKDTGYYVRAFMKF